LILGLPGETTQSWRNGIDEILSSGLKNQLFIYLCQVYANTDLADREYQKSFGIITKKIDLNEIHGNVRHNDWVSEIEEIVIATDSMPHEDWRHLVMISWVTMMIHSLKLGFFVLSWLHDRFLVSHIEFIEAIVAAGYKSNYPCHAAVLNAFASKIDRLAAGEGRGWIMQEFGSAYWDAEEAAFLMCSADFASYFAELHEITREFLGQRDISFDPTELADIIRYQVLRIPTPEGALAGAHLFTLKRRRILCNVLRRKPYLSGAPSRNYHCTTPTIPGTARRVRTGNDYVGPEERYNVGYCNLGGPDVSYIVSSGYYVTLHTHFSRWSEVVRIFCLSEGARVDVGLCWRAIQCGLKFTPRHMRNIPSAM
jgi:hypothetical protein